MWFPQDVSFGALRTISNATEEHCLFFSVMKQLYIIGVFSLVSSISPYFLDASLLDILQYNLLRKTSPVILFPSQRVLHVSFIHCLNLLQSTSYPKTTPSQDETELLPFCTPRMYSKPQSISILPSLSIPCNHLSSSVPSGSKMILVLIYSCQQLVPPPRTML